MNKKKLFSIMLFVVLLFSACSETINTSSSFSEAPIPPESFDTSIPEVVDTLNINPDIKIDFFQSKNSTDIKLERTTQISSGYFGQTFMHDGDIYTRIRKNSSKQVTFEKYDIEKQSSEVFFNYDRDCTIDFIDEETLLVTVHSPADLSVVDFYLYNIAKEEYSLFADKYSLLDFNIVRVVISGKTIFVLQEEAEREKYHITMIDGGGNVTIIDHTFEEDLQYGFFSSTTFKFIAKNGNLFIPYNGIYYLLNTNYSFPVPIFQILVNTKLADLDVKIDVVDDKIRILYYGSSSFPTGIEGFDYTVGNEEVALFEIDMLRQSFVGKYFAEDTYTVFEENYLREYYICGSGIVERVDEVTGDPATKVSPSDHDVIATYFIYYSIKDNKQCLFRVAEGPFGTNGYAYSGVFYNGMFFHAMFSSTDSVRSDYLNIIQGEILSAPAFTIT